jgi:hypothetical protein
MDTRDDLGALLRRFAGLRRVGHRQQPYGAADGGVRRPEPEEVAITNWWVLTAKVNAIGTVY